MVTKMSDEKHPPKNTVRPGSDDSDEPIDLSELNEPDAEDDDDGIIELKDEVEVPVKKKDEPITLEKEVDIGDDDEDEVLSLTNEFDAEDEEELELPEDLYLDDSAEDIFDDEDEDEELFALTDDISFDSEEDDELVEIEDDLDFEDHDDDEDDDVITLTDDAGIGFDDDEGMLKPLDETGLDFEGDGNAVLLTDETDIDAHDGDIIEINEFEEQYPEEKQSLPGSAAEQDEDDSDDDEFIELIDVEDESAPADHDLINFETADDSLSTGDVFDDQLVNFGDEDDEEDDDSQLVTFGDEDGEEEGEEIDNFFHDPFDEDGQEIEFDSSVEGEVAESLGMDSESGEEYTDEQNEVAKSLGIRPDDDMEEDDFGDDTPLEMASQPDLDLSDEEPDGDTPDFNLDTDIIADKKEELGTILFNDSEEDDIRSPALGIVPPLDEPEFEEPESKSEVADLGTISASQIEEAVERLIKNNYSDKIESIIVNVIEKAVSKEIERLKDALLRDISDSE
jgi:hypothetical protein